jgi:hypothetical protein
MKADSLITALTAPSISSLIDSYCARKSTSGILTVASSVGIEITLPLWNRPPDDLVRRT